MSYYDDWLDAFCKSDELDVSAFNIMSSDIIAELRDALPRAELIVLLHSTNADSTEHLDTLLPFLADRSCPLVSFVGNEVNLPGAPIAAKRSSLMQIAPEFIATQLPIEAGEFLWGDVATKKVLAVPHALNADIFRVENSQAERPIDIGVHAVRYLAHLGDDDRNRLHELFVHHDFAPDLRVEISSARLDRKRWAQFLNRCKGTVSTEAGSWYLEKDDATVNAISSWISQRTDGPSIVIDSHSPVLKVAQKLPQSVRVFVRNLLKRSPIRHQSLVNEGLEMAEIYERFFSNQKRSAVYSKCISSRHFDAVGAGVCQILLRGRYNDILQPYEHYIPLDTDYGNLDEVMATFQDPSERARIIANARDYIVSNHTYHHRVQHLLSEVL